MLKPSLFLLPMLAMAGPAAAQERGGEGPYWLDRAAIEAIGRGEIEVMPDLATFSVTFVETDREAGVASARAADRARLAVAAMRRSGADALQIRSEIDIAANYTEYRTREGYVEQREGAENIRSFTADVRLDVETTNLDSAAAVRAAALAVGPEDALPLQFSLRLTAENNRRVLAAAATDAAARARAAANATGAQLGPLLTLQEGAGPCLGGWRGARLGMVAPPPPPPAPRARDADADEEIVVTGSRIAGGRQQELVLTQAEIDRLELPADPEPIRLEAYVCAVYGVGG